jgi:hypothetical protein
MEAAPHVQSDPIVVSHMFPMPMRLIFGGVGVIGTIILLVELGPALWPPTFLTLFFGFIMLGGLSVTLAFAAGSALAPDQTWEIRPGRLTITYQLFSQASVKTYGLEDLDGSEVVENEEYESSRKTYQLVCRLPPGGTVQTGLESTPFLMSLLAALRDPLASLRGTTPVETRLRSPSFSERADAEKALALLLTR